MGKLVTVVCLVLLLSCGVESFKMSEKDYENIEKVLEFWVQVFLNCLDKLRDITEKMVRENQLRTNRIAIQGHWNSFKETANRFSVEERGKGVQDELIVAVRTVRRLLLFYKDDMKSMIHSLATKKGVQQYLPAVNLLEGVIKKEQWNEVWGSVESHYFPGAPSLRNDPLEFLCHLLSTNTMETFIVNILRNGVDVMSEIRNIDFPKLQERLHSALEAVREKANEFRLLERQKENDEFLLAMRVAARVCVFYWDRFLEYTDSPEFSQKLEEAEDVFKDGKIWETMNKMESLILPILNSDLFIESSGLYWDYFTDIYVAAFHTASRFIDNERRWKTARALSNGAIIVCAPVWTKLQEMNVYHLIETLYYRATNISFALIGEKELETFRGVVMEHWKTFKVEAYRVIEEERQRTTVFLLPQVKNLEKMRKICTEKLLASGLITREKLKESERVFAESFYEFLNLADEQGMRDSLWSLYKASLVFLNFIYAPLRDTWNFISV